MRSIYIVLTMTGTLVSRIVKFYTRKEYGHVSIALDKELEKMYSFGRLNPYNTFIGGFVHEYIHSGTFYRFRNTTSEVLRVRVTDEQYAKIEEIILNMEAEKEKYKFNIPGLFAVSINKKIQKENHLYCAEFVKYVLEEAGVVEGLPEIIQPEHFYVLPHKSIYKGLLRNYRYRVKFTDKELNQMEKNNIKLSKRKHLNCNT